MRGFLLAMGLTVLGVTALRLLLARRRELAALKSVAASRRLGFSPDDVIGVQRRYQRLNMIRRGHSRYASNILYGSGETGPICVFCYTFELGLGARAEQRRWWLAVVETPATHPGWEAATDAGDYPLELNGLKVRTERAAALNCLRQNEVEAVLRAAPADCRWEVAGRFVAAAVPFQENANLAEQVLDAAIAMARKLR